MSDTTTLSPSRPGPSSRDVLTDVLREGARRLLLQALEAEVASYLEEASHVRDEQGHRLVTRNGYLPERALQTGIGSVPVQQPRVRDRRLGEDGSPLRFTSKILPPYLRRTKSLEELIPWLYLKGISTGDFAEALAALLGPEAPGLSPATIVRLKEVWKQEFETWTRRSLEGKRYVYLWVDGIYFNIRLEEGRQCMLVVIGASEDGRKELVGILDGIRESEASWTELLVDLQHRGLDVAPALAIGDGALGFWKAVAKVFPSTRGQRCWVHKTANVLNYLPKGKQAEAKRRLHEIYGAEGRADAEKAFDAFLAAYGPKHPKVVECLSKDRESLLTFYEFPAEHWRHIRTTNVIESTFATVRLRTYRTKGSGSRMACLTMVFKLAQTAERSWRMLNGSKLLADVVRGVRFQDGTKQDAA